MLLRYFGDVQCNIRQRPPRGGTARCGTTHHWRRGTTPSTRWRGSRLPQSVKTPVLHACSRAAFLGRSPAPGSCSRRLRTPPSHIAAAVLPRHGLWLLLQTVADSSSRHSCCPASCASHRGQETSPEACSARRGCTCVLKNLPTSGTLPLTRRVREALLTAPAPRRSAAAPPPRGRRRPHTPSPRTSSCGAGPGATSSRRWRGGGSSSSQCCLSS